MIKIKIANYSSNNLRLAYRYHDMIVRSAIIDKYHIGKEITFDSNEAFIAALEQNSNFFEGELAPLKVLDGNKKFKEKEAIEVETEVRKKKKTLLDSLKAPVEQIIAGKKVKVETGIEKATDE